ncbi:hypothetical protein [Streptomyces sp. MBT62]|uniref:hypothetical protein n=1 Tax=Streptomyces sp. MBT62 TaxID=2800410 RepID=UPI00190DE458|nr:hypothetical protein [Streptomyces sp. MBT62]MBK3564512.1 hypothetical protein [Streptomyces sp. MBT62]
MALPYGAGINLTLMNLFAELLQQFSRRFGLSPVATPYMLRRHRMAGTCRTPGRSDVRSFWRPIGHLAITASTG